MGIKGNIGVLTQLSVVLGIFITQGVGLHFATPKQWRIVFIFSFAVSFVQLLASPFVVDSPAWLKAHGAGGGEDLIVRKKLWIHSK